MSIRDMLETIIEETCDKIVIYDTSAEEDVASFDSVSEAQASEYIDEEIVSWEIASVDGKAILTFNI